MKIGHDLKKIKYLINICGEEITWQWPRNSYSLFRWLYADKVMLSRKFRKQNRKKKNVNDNIKCTNQTEPHSLEILENKQ